LIDTKIHFAEILGHLQLRDVCIPQDLVSFNVLVHPLLRGGLFHQPGEPWHQDISSWIHDIQQFKHQKTIEAPESSSLSMNASGGLSSNFTQNSVDTLK